MYVSLVGFMFRQVRVKGLRVPYHTEFPEVNLRFYVRHQQAGQWKRGVVFINEIVPKPAITWVANTLFREHYRTLPMRHEDHTEGETLRVGYQWKYQEHWNRLTVDAAAVPAVLEPGSKEEFITEHFWGYSSMGPSYCGEYEVAHPRWDIHPVKSHNIACDFGGLYGKAFAGLSELAPASALRRRLYFEDIEVRRSRSKGVACRVTLRKGEQAYVGEAEGLENERLRIELAARATLSAISQAEGDARVLGLEGCKTIEAFDRQFVFVGLTTRTGRESALLTGSAEVKESQETASVLAVLDATNRWIDYSR